MDLSKIALVFIALVLLMSLTAANKNFNDCFFKQHKLIISKDLSLKKDYSILNKKTNEITKIKISLCNLADFIKKKTPPKAVASYSLVLKRNGPKIQVDISYLLSPFSKEYSKLYRIYIDPITADLQLIKYPSRANKRLLDRYAANYYLSEHDLNLLKYLIAPKYSALSKALGTNNKDNIQGNTLPEESTEDYFEFPADLNVYSGDGFYGAASGTKIIASNGIAVKINKIAIIGNYQLYLIFDIYFGNEKLNILPLMLSGSLFYVEGKVYGLRIAVDKSYLVQAIPIAQITQSIKDSNHISLELSSLIQEQVTSCTQLQDKCLEQNDSMTCSLICPNKIISEQEKLSTQNIDFFFSKT